MYSFLRSVLLRGERKLSARIGMMAFFVVAMFFGGLQTAQAQSNTGTSTATVTTDKVDYAPGEYVIITGTGWQPGETVSFHFDETPKPATCLLSHDITAVADADGKIYNNQFLIKENHLGVHFVLTATGLSSGRVAVTEFDDANIQVQASGLPAGASLSVQYRLGTSDDVVPTGSYSNTPTFTPPALPPTFDQANKRYIDFIFPDVIVAGVTYVATTINANGTVVSGPSLRYLMPNASAKTFTGIYVATCTSPSITTEPVSNSSTFTYGNNTSFTVVASGTATLTYQWEEFTTTWNTISNGGVYSGATTATLTLTKPSVAISGRKYRVKVTNSCGNVYTDGNATLMLTALGITGSFTADNKVYDGDNSAAVLSRTPNGVIGQDAVTLTGGTATFSDKNVANGKTVTLTGASLAGTDAGNYSLSSVGTTTANITAKSLIGSFTVANKIVDGNTSAIIVSRSVLGMIGTENVSLTGGSASFAQSTPGVGITVTGTGFSITGPDVNNYSLPVTTLTTTATIFNVANVTLSTPSPVVVSTTTTTTLSNITATLGPDVFNPVWNYTIPSGGVTSGATIPTGSTTAQLSIKSPTPVVYGVSLTYKDGMGGIYTTPTVYAVFYDPSAGFVTGGGWINSPVYSELPYMTVAGKANFGFESKYQKGKTVPTGNTEFQFQAGGLNFKSTSYEWLVIASNKAQYKGVGTVNGAGNYGFMLTAIDGDIASGTKKPDMFRIKIWDKSNGDKVVYDNQYKTVASDGIITLTEDGADPTTALGGGSIVIHEVKGGKTQKTEETQMVVSPQLTLANKLTLKAYPNPAVSHFNISLESNNTRDAITLKVYNQLGQVVDVKRNLFSGQVVQVGAAYKQGTYFLEVTQGEQKQNLQVVKSN